jgi:predicted CXXCH cytochrome family protein
VRSISGIPGLGAALLLFGAPAWGQVAGTAHDFWIPGGGPPGSGGGGETCIFCHAPHTAVPGQPLWNRHLPKLVYTPYSSSSMQAKPGQPTGSSKLCLSCHDGTIALGALASGQVLVGSFGKVKGRPNLGTDLSDDHPISFVYDATLAAEDGELVHPDMLTGSVKLDINGEMQCMSCHDAHTDDFGNFLLEDPKFSALCNRCHAKRGWKGSSHDTSSAPYGGGGIDPWPETDWDSVAAAGCSNCHTSHAAGYAETLLRFPVEEDNCLVCHDGTVAKQDIASELTKPYRHPVESFFGVHDSEEEFFDMPRHVECHDCHDPHAAVDGVALPPDTSGPSNGARGVSLSGAAVDGARYQYEVCLRCHGDNPSEPSPIIERQHSERNLRIKIGPQNPSFHPIAAPGRNPEVPSLLSPWTPASIIYCTDCHASDEGPGAQGPGPSGPHGSRWRFLLEREYSTGDGTQESQNAYDLCYKCHNRNSILGDQSFPSHQKHVTDSRTPCSVCHEPHGVIASAADASSGTHLINFDVSVVTPDPGSGLLQFEDLGMQQGRCYLTCHGNVHGPKEY